MVVYESYISLLILVKNYLCRKQKGLFMKKYLLITLLLGGCAIAQQQQFKAAMSDVRIQEDQQCSKYRYEAPKSYYKYQQCRSDIFNTRLAPLMPAYSKITYQQMEIALATWARKADKEKIADTDFGLGADKIRTDAAASLQQQESLIQAQNAASWQRAAQMNATIQAANRPRQTFCNGTSGNIACTTY